MQTLINRSASPLNYSKANLYTGEVTQKQIVAHELEKQTLSTIDVWKIRSMSKPAGRRQHRFVN